MRAECPPMTNQLAKAVADFATPKREPDPEPHGKNPAPVAPWRLGGLAAARREPHP
jgi:hypothetical protein